MAKQAFFGDFGGSAQFTPQNQLRIKMAQELLNQGQQPVQSMAEGFTRLGSGALGGYFAGQAMRDEEARKAGTQSTLADALKAYTGMPAETKSYAGGKTINWNAREGSPQMAAQILAQNPDTAATGFNLYASEANAQRDLANQLMMKQMELEASRNTKQMDFANQRSLEEFRQNAQDKRAQDAAMARLGYIPEQRVGSPSGEQAPIIPPMPAGELGLPSSQMPSVPPQVTNMPMTNGPTNAPAQQSGAMPQQPGSAPLRIGGYVKSPVPVKLSSQQQKELFEAQDKGAAAKAAMQSLQAGLELLGPDDKTSKIYSGTGSTFQQLGARALSTVGFAGPETEQKLAATTDYDNLMKSQALEQLRSTFGGNPTEGERTMLMELQAISSYTPQEQRAIINRAIELAKRRQAAEFEKSQAIQQGSYDYFTPDYGTDPAIEGLLNTYGGQ